MIEATCSACGTLNRIAEADVPMGAKFVNCTSCKSRVALPAKLATLPKVPPPVPPKGPPAVALGPAGGKNDIIDLADLPAPRRASALGGEASKPAPRSALSLADDELPAPKPRAPAPLDLDDMLSPSDSGVSDLPAPRTPRPAQRPSAPAPAPAVDVSDLPAPRNRASAPSTAPRTVPASNQPVIDLPAPRSGQARALTDLPVPKAAAPKAAAPRAAQAGPADLPTPKGQSGAELPAPKGFFDDLPQPVKGAPSRGIVETPEVPAPKGFFDDLPQPARSKSQSVAPKQTFGAGALDLGDDPIEPMELAPEEPGLDLAGPGNGSFDQLDLSAPSTPQSRVGAEEAEKAGIKFAPKKAAAPGAPSVEKATLPSFSKGGTNGALELEEPRDKAPTPGKGPSQRLGPRDKEPPTANEALLARQRKKRRNILAGFAVGVALLGSGGFYMYRRHAAAQERADAISESVATARKAMLTDDPNHWQRAAAAASKVLELDPKHAEAYGIGAEASIAGALADGKTAAPRIAKGRKLISDALAAGITGPALERAQALSTLTSAPDKAIAKFNGLLAKSPKDGSLALYLGWAYAANGNMADAIKAYERAFETPSVKVLALLGRARARLVGNDVEGARADFSAILEVQKDNIPAQVGLAATLPITQSQQQESDLLAILARKDIATGDPRAVVQAWVLSADLARKSGRLDVARERYRKALALDAKDLGGMTGLAEVELREKKVELAEDLITKVLTMAPNDANAQLVQCEISIRKGDIPDAEKRIKLLADRSPPLAPLDLSRLMIVKGKLHEANKAPEEAIAAYVEAAKLAGDRDLTGTFAAVATLTGMAKDAEAKKDIPKEQALRARAEELLLQLAELAHKDPDLARTLGMAYLQSGAPAKAEPWLRRVIEARPKDADALYQLGKVLRRLGNGADAIDKLVQAREIEPTRAEIGMELARTYELTRRDAEADKLYSKLLDEGEPSLELRGHAGKFFVRTGKLDKAGVQGDKILESDRLNAAGHYLKAEGLLAAGHLEDARKEFTAAVDVERDAQSLDGLGRATESMSMMRKELSLQDAAIRAYKAALELDPTLFSPNLGLGRLYVARREMSKAVTALLAANKLKGDDAEVAFNLGVAYQELGTKETKRAAVEWLKRSNGIKRTAETSFRLGQLYQDKDIDQVQPAIDSYKTATSLADDEIKRTGVTPPWYGEALYYLGDLANSVGEEVTACKAWRAYLVAPGTKNPVRVGTVNRALGTNLQGVCQ